MSERESVCVSIVVRYRVILPVGLTAYSSLGFPRAASFYYRWALRAGYDSYFISCSGPAQSGQPWWVNPTRAVPVHVFPLALGTILSEPDETAL